MHGKRELVAAGEFGHRCLDARATRIVKLDGRDHLCRHLSAAAGMFGQKGVNNTCEGVKPAIGGDCARKPNGQRVGAGLFQNGRDGPCLICPGDGR